ncbi:MAG: histidine phosphatase family protein [Ktedonobacteraceae bacterium]|nr:histidine phosphatase family protein [Ktedonobacteraceae bacterium]
MIFGNETAAQALQRFSSAVSTVVRRHQAGDIVVVTHGTVMTLFVVFHGQAEAFTFWWSLSMPKAIVLTLPDYRLARRYS